MLYFLLYKSNKHSYNKNKRTNVLIKNKGEIIMLALRRYAFILVVLIVGMFLGNMSLNIALLVLTPLVLIWLMLWDDKNYKRRQKQDYMKKQQHYCSYKK